MVKKEYKQNPKIVVSDTTKKQLDKLKLVNMETYDSIIIRLIEQVSKRSDGVVLKWIGTT